MAARRQPCRGRPRRRQELAVPLGLASPGSLWSRQRGGETAREGIYKKKNRYAS